MEEMQKLIHAAKARDETEEQAWTSAINKIIHTHKKERGARQAE